MLRPTKTRLLTLLLTLGVLFQVYTLYPTLKNDLTQSWNRIGKPSLWRSALYYGSENFADYVEFLNQAIPANARVVLPPKEVGPYPIGITPIMQTYLAPREVINCTQVYQDCINNFLKSNRYILLFEEALIGVKDLQIPSERLEMHNDSWGIILPPSSVDTTPTAPLFTFDSRIQIVLTALPRLLFIASLAISGLLITHTFLPDKPVPYKLALGFGLAVGLSTLGLYLLFLLGLPVTKSGIWIFFVFFYLLTTMTYYLRAKQHPLSLHPITLDAWQTLILLFGAALAFISIGFSYHTTDALLIWASKGYGISASGLSSGVSQWGTLTTRYPLNIPIWIAVFKTLFNELLPASKLLFPLLAVCLMLIFYHHLGQHTPKHIAGLTTLLLATSPVFFRHTTIGYTNLPTAFYFVTAVLLLIDKTSLPLTSAFFILAAWTRPEAAIISLAFIILTLLFNRKTSLAQNTKTLLIPTLLYFITWTFTAPLIYTESTQDQHFYTTALNQVLNGSLHLKDLWFIISYFAKQIITIEKWGLTGFLIIILMIHFLITKTKQHAAIKLIAAGLFYIIMIFGVYYLTAFNTTQNQTLSWWVGTGLDRMVLPGILLVSFGLIENYCPKDTI